MKILMQWMLWVTAAAFLGGCAWVPQNVNLKPEPKVTASGIGNGTRVALKVLDIRPSKIIGYRGMDSKLAKITSTQDLVEIVREKISEGLAKKGFQIVPHNEQAQRILKVEIRAVEYSTDSEFWKGTAKAKAALQAFSKNDYQTFDQVYVAQKEEAASEAPRAKTNERLINGAIAEAMQRLLEDQKLVYFLTN